MHKISLCLSQRQCLSLLVRLAGTDRARYLKQMEESVAPGDPVDKREEMELAMQQVWERSEAFSYLHKCVASYTHSLSVSLCLWSDLC